MSEFLHTLITISLNFVSMCPINNKPALLPIMGRSHYLNQWWSGSFKYICVPQTQWVIPSSSMACYGIYWSQGFSQKLIKSGDFVCSNRFIKDSSGPLAMKGVNPGIILYIEGILPSAMHKHGGLGLFWQDTIDMCPANERPQYNVTSFLICWAVYAPSQWEITLQCSIVSHWLGCICAQPMRDDVTM